MLEFQGKKFTINKNGEYVEMVIRKHEKIDFKRGLQLYDEPVSKQDN